MTSKSKAAPPFCSLPRLLLTIAVGNEWVNWALVGSCLVALLLLQCYREHSNRLNLDRQPETQINA